MYVMVLLMMVAANDPRAGHEYKLHTDDGKLHTFATEQACIDHTEILIKEIVSHTDKPFTITCRKFKNGDQ